MSKERVAGTKVSPAEREDARPGILDALGARARAALLAKGTERAFAAGELLYLAGAPAHSLYLVLEGRVRLLRESHGRTVYLHDEIRGGCLGAVPLFEGTTYPATALASEPTRCVMLNRDAVLEAVRSEPELAQALLATLAARVRQLVEQLERTASQTTLSRLAGRLLTRAMEAKGRPFTLGITQEQAAEELGTVRELVVRGLRTLRDRGAIAAAGGGRYLVIDELLLRRIAETIDRSS